LIHGARTRVHRCFFIRSSFEPGVVLLALLPVACERLRGSPRFPPPSKRFCSGLQHPRAPPPRRKPAARKAQKKPTFCSAFKKILLGPATSKGSASPPKTSRATSKQGNPSATSKGSASPPKTSRATSKQGNPSGPSKTFFEGNPSTPLPRLSVGQVRPGSRCSSYLMCCVSFRKHGCGCCLPKKFWRGLIQPSSIGKNNAAERAHPATNEIPTRKAQFYGKPQ